MGRAPKGNERIPTLRFQVLLLMGSEILPTSCYLWNLMKNDIFSISTGDCRTSEPSTVCQFQGGFFSTSLPLLWSQANRWWKGNQLHKPPAGQHDWILRLLIGRAGYLWFHNQTVRKRVGRSSSRGNTSTQPCCAFLRPCLWHLMNGISTGLLSHPDIPGSQNFTLNRPSEKLLAVQRAGSWSVRFLNHQQS